MKIPIFLTLFSILLSYHSLGNIIEDPTDGVDVVKIPTEKNIIVKISDDDDEVSCKLIEKTPYYSCKSLSSSKSKNQYMIKDVYGYEAVKISPDGNLDFVSVEKVRNNSSVLYQAGFLSDLGMIATIGDQIKQVKLKDLSLNEEYNHLKNILDNFFSHIPKDIEVAKEIIEIAAPVSKRYKEVGQKLAAVRSSEELKLKLDNKKEIICKRLPSTTPERSCAYMECPSENKGEKSIVFYDDVFFPSVMPIVQTIKDGKFTGSKDISKIFSAKSNQVLATPEYILKQPEDSFNLRRQNAKELLQSSMPNQINNYSYLKDDFRIELSSTHDSICAKHPLINEYKNASSRLETDVSLLNFEILVQLTEDGSIMSKYLDPLSAVVEGCYYNGMYFDEHAAKKIDFFSKQHSIESPLNQEAISLDKASELFNKARAMTNIAWNYVDDGCFARAHLMADAFEKEGVRVDKIWLQGNLTVPEYNTSWRYHVAPIVYVKDGDQIKKMVIDPSIFNKPVTIEEWDKKIQKVSGGKSEYVKYPFPLNADYASKNVLTITDKSIYMPGQIIDLTYEDSLQYAQDIMDEYKEYAREI